MHRIVTCLLLALAASAMFSGGILADQPQGFQMSKIRIDTRQGRSLRFDVYLALSRDQQIRGLMHVDQLADREGMLFVYPQVRPVSIWMKDTPLPLDIVFIRDDGTIARIAKHATPFSLASIRSEEPVRGVLELNAGVSDELRLGDGDLVVSGFFEEGGGTASGD